MKHVNTLRKQTAETPSSDIVYVIKFTTEQWQCDAMRADINGHYSAHAVCVLVSLLGSC